MQTPRVQHLIETYRTNENDTLETQPDFYLPLFRQAAEHRTCFSEKKEELSQFLSTLNTINCTKTFAIAIRILLDNREKKNEPTQSELRCAAIIWGHFDPEKRTQEHFDLAIYLAKGLNGWERSVFTFYDKIPVQQLKELVDEIRDLLHPKQPESKHRLIARFYKLSSERKSQELALLRQYPNLFLLSEKISLVDFFWKIPEPQRQSLLELANPYLKQMRRKVHAFMEGLLKMSPAHRQNVLKLSVDFCRDLDDGEDIMRLLKNVYYIASEKIATVLEACKEVCLQFKNPEDRRNIIVVYARCHPTDYAFINGLLLQYRIERLSHTSSFPNLNLIPQFLSNLRSFPAQEREEIMEELKTLFALGNHYLLNMFRTVPRSERKEFFRLLKPFLDACEWNNIYYTLEIACKIPLAKLKKILMLIEPHLCHIKANLNIVIKNLTEAKPENRKLVLHYLIRYREFVFNNRVDETVLYLIEHKQENVITLMEYLCGGVPQNGYDRGTVLNELMFLPKSETTSFIRIVYPLVRHFDRRKDHVRQQIIGDFCRISPSDRKSVAKWLTKYRLLTPSYNHDAKRIVRIPRNERKAIYSLADPLSSDPNEKLVLSLKILEIPRSRRKGIIQSLGKRAELILGSPLFQKLHIHTDSELKSMIALTEAVLVGDLQNVSFINLFHAISLLPKEIRGKTVEESKPFLLATDSPNISDLFNILRSLPDQNKEEFLSQSIPIYKMIQQPYMRIHFLKWAANTPFERFNGLGKLLSPLISQSPEKAPFLLFDGFSMLSQEKREKAIILWHKHLKDIQCESARKILFALSRFPIEQWDQMILSLCKVTSDGAFHDTLIDVFGEYPAEKRDAFIKRIQPVAANFSNWERSVIYKELLLFPEEELSALLPLLARLTRECSYFSVIKALPHIRNASPSDQTTALQLLIELAPFLREGEEIDNLVALFCSLPGFQKRNLLTNLIPLSPYIASPKQLLEIIKCLKPLSNTEQQCFIEHFIEFSHLVPHFTDSAIAAFAAVPAAKRLDLIRELAPFLIRDEYHDSPGMILLHCAQLSLQDVKHILQSFQRLEACVPDFDSYAQPKILISIAQIPQEDREKVITFIESHHLIIGSFLKTSQNITSLYHNLKNGHEFILKEIIQELSFNCNRALVDYSDLIAAIPEKEERLEIYRHFSHFTLVSREILEEYLKIKREERSQIHGYLLELKSTSKCSDYNLAACLKVFREIPLEERPHVFEISNQLLSSFNEGKSAESLIHFIGSLSRAERLEIVNLAHTLGIDRLSNHDMTKYLRQLSVLPKDRRQSIFEFVCGFAESHLDRIVLIKAANRYTRFELEDIENWLNPLLANLETQNKAQMVIFISYFSSLERKWLIQLGEKLRGTCFIKSLCGFAHTMTFIPHKLRLKAIDYMALRPESDWNNLSCLFRTQDSIRIASHEYIAAKLDKCINNSIKAYEFAKSIIARADELMIHTEHPLYQRAVEIMCVSDPSGQLNPKNPYTLYLNLKKIHQSEELIRNQPDTLRLDTVRSRAKAKQYTCADLPKDVPQQGFQLLFNELEKRLNRLQQADFNKTNSYIQNSFSASLTSLRESFLGSMLINNFLNVKGQPSDVIETPIFCLHAILKAVWSSSNELKEDVLLSPREEMLLRVSASVKECPTGQRDGIVNYYNFLSIQYRTSEAVMRVPEARAAAVVDQAVQKAMNDVLSSDVFIKELLDIKNGKIGLMPHQSLYVKNRLCLQLGLIHRLSLDFHSGVIITELLNIPLEKMVAVFFKHFTVSSVVKQVKHDIRDGFKCKAVGYMDVTYLIDSLIVSESGGNYELYFETDGDLSLTDKGAVAILRALQYL